MATITKSIGTDSRDYSTMTLWEAALNGASGGAGNDAIGECYNDTPFAESFTINDSTPDSILLQAESNERHDGTAGSGVRNIVSALSISVQIAVSIKWLELDANSGASYIITTNYAADNSIFTNNIIHNAESSFSGGVLGINILSSANNCIVHNNIIYDLVADGDNAANSVGIVGAVADLYNNTIHSIKKLTGSGNAICVDSDDTTGVEVQNNIATDPSNTGSGSAECYSVSSPSNATMDHNLSSDSSASGTGSLTSKTSADQFVSIVGGSEDLHLKSGADAIGTGTDLGTNPTGVNIDIDGRDRDSEGDTWDIGADQFVAVGGSTILPRKVNGGLVNNSLTRQRLVS